MELINPYNMGTLVQLVLYLKYWKIVHSVLCYWPAHAVIWCMHFHYTDFAKFLQLSF